MIELAPDEKLITTNELSGKALEQILFIAIGHCSTCGQLIKQESFDTETAAYLLLQRAKLQHRLDAHLSSFN